MKKNTLIVLVTACILLAIGGVYFSYKYLSSVRQDTTVSPDFGKKPEVPIKEYILGGKVSAVEKDKIKVDVQKLVETERGNVLTGEVKVAVVGNTTQIYLSKFVSGKLVKTKAKLSDVKVGDNVNMHSKFDMQNQVSFVPTSVEIMR
jgi:hypothetical protein